MSEISARTDEPRVLKQALARLIAEKAKEAAQKQYGYCPDFKSLYAPLDEWSHCQYRCVATLLDISISTVKRLFNCNGYTNQQRNISRHTEEKIKAFLYTDNWEKEALYYILKHGLSAK